MNKRSFRVWSASISAVAALPLVLTACNAIIGTEDRFFAEDAAVSALDGSTDATVATTADGSTGDGSTADAASGSDDEGDADDAALPTGTDAADASATDGATGSDAADAADGSNAGRSCVGASCPVAAVITFPTTIKKIVSLDGDGTNLFVHVTDGTSTYVYRVDEAGAAVMPGAFWQTDGTQTLLQVQVFGSLLYMLMTDTMANEQYLYSCPLAAPSCPTATKIMTTDKAAGFLVANATTVYWFGAGNAWKGNLAPDGSGVSVPVPAPRSVAYNASQLFVGGDDGINRIPLANFASSNVSNSSNDATSVVADAVNVYAADTQHGNIVEMSGLFSNTTVANLIAPNRASPSALNIDVDAGALFWLEQTSGASHASVQTCPTPSCGDVASTTLTAQVTTPSLLLVRPEAIFVADMLGAKATVLRLAR